jgi:glutamate racemase
MTKIGVFDSGIGGRSVANAIELAFPDDKVTFVCDSKNVPYGTKSREQLLSLALPILKAMETEAKCDAVVVACNTVTTTIIDEVRATISVPVIAIEPMVKPAAAITKTGVIAVCATPATLKSDRYKLLKETYACNIKVIEPDCSNWALLIEQNKLDRQQISETIDNVLKQQADVIVLGCTHYHWIEQDIKQLADQRAIVIQPENAIIARLKATLKLPV